LIHLVRCHIRRFCRQIDPFRCIGHFRFWITWWSFRKFDFFLRLLHNLSKLGVSKVINIYIVLVHNLIN
jgi:hypothetical protein